MSSGLAPGVVSRTSLNSAVADNQIVAAVSGKKHRLISCALVAGSSGATFIIESDTTELCGIVILGNNGTFILPQADMGWLETVENKDLDINVTAGELDGCIVTQAVN